MPPGVRLLRIRAVPPPPSLIGTFAEGKTYYIFKVLAVTVVHAEGKRGGGGGQRRATARGGAWAGGRGGGSAATECYPARASRTPLRLNAFESWAPRSRRLVGAGAVRRASATRGGGGSMGGRSWGRAVQSGAPSGA
jgi:hypothetical protein